MCLIEDFQEVFATDNYPPGWIIIFSVAKEIHSLLILRWGKVKIDPTDASACSLAHFPFSPPKHFSGLRRKAVAVEPRSGWRIAYPRWSTRCHSRREAADTPRRVVPGPKRQISVRKQVTDFREASAGRKERKRDRQTRFSLGWFLFITKTDDSWSLARNPDEMVRVKGGAVSCRLGSPARLLGEAIHPD